MTSVSKLKDKARDFERKEDWGKAVDAYLQVIAATEKGDGDAELSLYNRVGDLYLRLGQPGNAVEYYARAADHYGEAGLYNNAIALCNKALRYEPDRVDLYRKLGKLSAEQGFITDARRWYLEYAERLAKALVHSDMPDVILADVRMRASRITARYDALAFPTVAVTAPDEGTAGFRPKLANWRRAAKVPMLILNASTLNTGHTWQFTAAFMGEQPARVRRPAAERMAMARFMSVLLSGNHRPPWPPSRLRRSRRTPSTGR